MEIFIVVLMALLYIVPEIIRKTKNKEYKYPEFPKPKQPTITPMPHPVPELKADKPIKPSVVMPPPVDVPDFIDERPELSQNAWAQGLIMAEILNPPRARRPKYTKKKN